MASKLEAARIASWSGVRAVIAACVAAGRAGRRLAGASGIGTVFRGNDRRLPARKLWIAFASGSYGTITVDDGARRALVERSVSLLPAGVLEVEGEFEAGEPVDVAGPDGRVFARGIAAADADTLARGGRPAHAPTCRRRCGPRPSTATTWSCCPG